ncbi:hypothetical protein L1987_37790 [Smallanthus sonchifolius]|uniref:Uncharacterized protein n=1 Tax=Smallanthus sonchifolius TaxID=185202 RepID=A0ACB9HHA8_9ASTR|nr:hypothetical protein L1987_37790 [Smallanthus sonchifolius]
MAEASSMISFVDSLYGFDWVCAVSPKTLQETRRHYDAYPTAASKSKSNLGFKNLMESFTVDIHRAEGRQLNVPLIAPFTIATSKLEGVENVAIRVELSEACEFLNKCQAMSLGDVLREIGQLLPGHDFASVRAGVEMAVIDAVATSIGTPLWRFFGGVSNTITTDITIPIVSPTEAGQLASKYYTQGFKTLKLKAGRDLNADIEVLKAIRLAHPHCLFILDANEGYTSSEAIQVLENLHDVGSLSRFSVCFVRLFKAIAGL